MSWWLKCCLTGGWKNTISCTLEKIMPNMNFLRTQWWVDSPFTVADWNESVKLHVQKSIIRSKTELVTLDLRSGFLFQQWWANVMHGRFHSQVKCCSIFLTKSEWKWIWLFNCKLLGKPIGRYFLKTQSQRNSVFALENELLQVPTCLPERYSLEQFIELREVRPSLN